MKYTNVILNTLLLLLCSSFYEKPAYRLFNKDGKESSYENMIQEASRADVVLFGELHNNAISHWLELQLTKDLLALKKKDLVLGAEMFEADDQLVINEFLNDQINSQQLETEAKVWQNFQTDYKPLLDFAQSNKLPFIATNIPRRYASLVARSDINSLEQVDKQAKQWIAPLPIEIDLELPGYKKMLDMAQHGQHGHGGIKPENMAKAQAIKDATMAHFILKNWQQGKTFIHFNGSYHSDKFEGIAWYLKKQNPSLKIVTISSVEQADISKLTTENKGLADYVVAIPEDMTKTY